MSDAAAEAQRGAAAGQSLWWINSVLAHRCDPDTAVGHLPGSVSFGDDAPTTWPLAFGRLRVSGVDHLDLRLPEPGDALGLPGPAEVTRTAVAAGVALVSDGSEVTVIPVADGTRWVALASTPAPRGLLPLGTPSEARGLMRTAMAELTASLPGLDPDDEALALIGRLRGFQGPAPAPGVAPESAQLATDALRVWWLTMIATDLAVRRGVEVPAGVRSLRPLARRAACVAFSEPLTGR